MARSTNIYLGSTLVNTPQALDLGSGFVSIPNKQDLSYIKATGGTETISGSFKIHTFTSDSNIQFYNLPAGATFEFLAVGGGGAGNQGGGGGGQVVYSASYDAAGNFSTGTNYTVTIGQGGVPSTSSLNNGGTTTLGSISSIGGGAGGLNSFNNNSGSNGANGGGAPFQNGLNFSSLGSGGDSTTGGYRGGGVAVQSGYETTAGGGGGGAGQNGGNSAFNYNCGGNGGNGIANSISGTQTYYGGGGCGGRQTNSPVCSGYGAGGLGGGGSYGQNGTANTGGGGGGQEWTGAFGTGGSGVLIIKYRFQA